MKILCVIDSLGSGGAQRQLVNLAVGFREKGHKVSFLVYHSINFFKEVLDENNISVNEIIESNYLKRLMKMRRFIRQGNFDSVLSFLEAANFICEIAGLPRRKWGLVVGERSANPSILKSFKLRAYRWFHVFADSVVGNSRENIKMVRKINPFLSQEKCKIIYNIVDFENFKPSIDYIPRKDGKLKIIIAASHQYLKNLNGLIEAVNQLSINEKNNLAIDWYGNSITPPFVDNSYTEGVVKIKKYGLVKVFKFYPATHDISNVMMESDVVGLFSKYEGLPNAVCEGMACAKPIVCTQVSDNSILINKTELLSNYDDPSSIAQSLTYLLSLSTDKLQHIGNTNRQKALLIFNNEQIINKYLNCLEGKAGSKY